MACYYFPRMTQEAKKLRENEEEEARAELIKKYGEPYVSGTGEVIEEVEVGARIETVFGHLNRKVRELEGTKKEVVEITEKGVVRVSQKYRGKTLGSGGILPIETEFWVIPPEPKDES
jgi:ATP-dependent RNA circularization protein (DNA/RNA ligase family)